MNESDYVWSLISSRIEKFKLDLYDDIKEFYEGFDVTKTINRQFILDLISRVNIGLDDLYKEIKK